MLRRVERQPCTCSNGDKFHLNWRERVQNSEASTAVFLWFLFAWWMDKKWIKHFQASLSGIIWSSLGCHSTLRNMLASNQGSERRLSSYQFCRSKSKILCVSKNTECSDWWVWVRLRRIQSIVVQIPEHSLSDRQYKSRLKYFVREPHVRS